MAKKNKKGELTPEEQTALERIAHDQEEKKAYKPHFAFERKNYMVMLIGIGLIALGYILMAGGGSDDPNVFNPAIYSWRRIRLAPFLVLLGFAVEFYAILLNPETTKKKG